MDLSSTLPVLKPGNPTANEFLKSVENLNPVSFKFASDLVSLPKQSAAYAYGTFAPSL